ncbi:unnamed protein product [Triticum turgidum subsp. durum]|uniref:Uncharacterized protein n=1 Tax=Triticum turgidum subsp. durum TaxID=4567 RepID=A0A9R1B6P3_TRITD|nr:unnamed protein product [Triticum turgidum subsp. durum]
MLRLRSCILAHLLSSPTSCHRSPSPLRRLLSAAAPPIPPRTGFAVEEYLVDTCGLTRAQALKASTKLSHLRSPTKPDAVLAFLAGLGLSTADVAAAVARDPQLLCAGVERTLSPIVAGLTGLSLPHSEIARLLSLSFRCKSVVSKVHYYLRLFGSSDKFLQAFKRNNRLLSHSLERVVKANVALLQECTLGACDIAKVCTTVPRMLTASAEQIQAAAAFAEGLGVPRGSVMFRKILLYVELLGEDKIAAKVKYLKSTLGWSDAEDPSVLRRSKNMLQRRSEFLLSELGLEPAYIAHRSAMLTYSLEGRLRPCYYVVKFQKENGLLAHSHSYYKALL